MIFNIMDTYEMEQFDSINQMYLKKAEATIIVYNIKSSISFERLRKFVDILDDLYSD